MSCLSGPVYLYQHVLSVCIGLAMTLLAFLLSKGGYPLVFPRFQHNANECVCHRLRLQHVLKIVDKLEFRSLAYSGRRP